MSQETVELVRSAYEAIARRDREALAAILRDHVTPEFEFEAVLTGATYKGVDALWELLDDIQDTVGSQSGVSVAQRGAVLFRFDGSTLVSGKSFASRAEALEAAGLRE